jgi:hypothetical protein
MAKQYDCIPITSAVACRSVADITKDVVVAILGASVALAGLLLVFCGFVFSRAASFPVGTSDPIKQKWKNAALWGLLPFLMSMADAMLAAAWFVWQCPALYRWTLGVFFVVLLFTAGYGVIIMSKYL